MNTDPAVDERIDDLAAEARTASDSFVPPASPPDEQRATEIAREHVGPVVSTFVEIRTGGRSVYLDPETYDSLESTMNVWLERYAACYGVDLEPDSQLRTAAQLMVDTHNARDVAALLTGIPERTGADDGDALGE